MLVSELSGGYLGAMAAWLALLTAATIAGLKLRQGRQARGKSLRWVHAALSVVTFLAALTAVELFFALCYDASDSLNMTNLSQRWSRRHVRLNPEQFRDERPLAKEPPPGRRRVAFLGDSFTFGQGVDDVRDRFSNRIEAALERDRPGKFEVVNLGVQGLATPQLAKVVEHALTEQYRLDVVVYVVCLNDIDRFYADIEQLYRRMEPRKPTCLLFRDTFFLNLLYIHAQQFTIPELRMYGELLPRWYAGVEWQRMQQSLQGMHATCRDAGVELRIAIFPMVDLLGPSYPFAGIHRQITEFCQREGIRTLDLEPALAPHVREGLQASLFDEHPSALAHRLAADAMRESLLDDLFQADGASK